MHPPLAPAVAATCTVLPRHGACLVCRKRKLKCDATKPECYECTATSRKCQYEDDTYRSRTQQLQDRIKELEARIQSIEQQGSSLASDPSSSLSDSSGGRLTSNSPGGSNSSNHPSSFGGAARTSQSASSPGNSLSAELGSSFPSSPSPGMLASELPVWTKPAGPELSSEQTKTLLEVFILRQSQCGFELHVDRLIASLRPGSPDPVIPALLNVMLLLACHFAEDVSFKAWETTLLDRTKSELENNLARALEGKPKYNAIHHLQAMCMLGQYYYIKGRLLEGHFQCSNACRFGVALGVHQLTSRIFRRDSIAKKVKRVLGPDRWRPRDPVELGEAINVWWICCTLDYGGSVMNGLPPSVPREEVTTVWPCLLGDFEHGTPLPDDKYSIAALLDPQLSYEIADVSHDNGKAAIAKACTLMERAGQLDTERIAKPQVSEEWWARFEDCDRSVIRFMQTMPPVNLARNVEELAYLVLMHTAIYCSNVQLHSALADVEIMIGAQGDPRGIQPDGSLGGISYLRCTEACRATALAATLVADIDLTYMHMFIGLAWVCVAQVLTREVPRLRASGHVEQAQEKERQMAVMERSMERLVDTYPILSLQVKQLQAMKNW